MTSFLVPSRENKAYQLCCTLACLVLKRMCETTNGADKRGSVRPAASGSLVAFPLHSSHVCARQRQRRGILIQIARLSRMVHVKQIRSIQWVKIKRDNPACVRTSSENKKDSFAKPSSTFEVLWSHAKVSQLYSSSLNLRCSNVSKTGIVLCVPAQNKLRPLPLSAFPHQKNISIPSPQTVLALRFSVLTCALEHQLGKAPKIVVASYRLDL